VLQVLVGDEEEEVREEGKIMECELRERVVRPLLLIAAGRSGVRKVW
jgi:hypothetical protein